MAELIWESQVTEPIAFTKTFFIRYIVLKLREMSELRRFLRYELTGLSMIANSILIIIYFNLIFNVDIFRYYIDNGLFASFSVIISTTAIASLLLGWLVFQLFEDICKPHYKTESFRFIRKRYPRDKFPNLRDSQCLSIIDCILRDDMYHKYPGLADNLRHYWDIYYSRRIIGIGTPMISFLTFIVLSIYFNKIINYLHEIASSSLYLMQNFSYLTSFEFYMDIDYLGFLKTHLYLLILLVINMFYIYIGLKSNRIFKEIEFQEFLFVKENVFKLNYEYTNHTLNGMAIETPGTQMANLKG